MVLSTYKVRKRTVRKQGTMVASQLTTVHYDCLTTCNTAFSGHTRYTPKAGEDSLTMTKVAANYCTSGVEQLLLVTQYANVGCV
jgi:hypothetical protein